MIVEALWALLYGMGGIFLVMGAVTGVIMLFGVASRKGKRKSGQSK